MLFSIGLFASDVPIIFVHGHKSEARPEGSSDDPNDKSVGGWATWYPRDYNGITLKFPTAMTKIIGYQGYHYGLKADGTPAITCDKTTQLQPNQGTKRIFNFSYYHPDGSRGVIGNNVNDTTEKENNPSFWRKLSYGIGYEGGICYTGPDLKRYVHGYSYDFTTILYWLNSIEVSITYPVKDGKGIEVGGGVNYAKLPQRDFSNAYWDFRNFQGSIKVLKNKVSFGLIGYYSWIRKVDKRYEDTDNNPYTPGEFVGYDVYSGRGKGFAIIFKIYHKWRHGKFGVSFTLGSIKCKVESISHFETLSLNGIHLFWNWRISEKGGIK